MSTRTRLVTALLGLALAATFLVAWIGHDWIVRSDTSACAYRNVVGKDCCFCGLTRSFAHFTHGEWAEAQAANPGWWAAALLVGGFALALVTSAVLNRDLMVVCRRGWRRWWWAGLLLLAVLTALRAL